METLSIGQLADRSGVAVSAIRYYERIGLLPIPSRVSGRRRYPSDTLQSLALIRLGQKVGFTLAELRELRMSAGLGPAHPHWAGLLGRKLEATGAEIERLQHAKGLLASALACGCADITACARRDTHP
jgi:MerR family redox-sensitive transcriptional activator SoxR